MTKALTQHLEGILAQGRGLFVPYIMAGDHENGLNGLFETIHHLEALGVSAIEVGVPFSDPVADGPVIEAAGLRSLEKGTSLKGIVETIKSNQTNTPLVLMSYFNPIYQYDLATFVEDINGTAIKGLIIPDLPYEHEEMVKSSLLGTDISLISLVSLTTGLDRQKTLTKEAEGFVYAVAVNGVTGRAQNYRDDLNEHLSALKSVSPIPVLTGFGVSTKEDIERFNAVSDGVIVGSRIVKALHEKDSSVDELIKFGSHFEK